MERKFDASGLMYTDAQVQHFMGEFALRKDMVYKVPGRVFLGLMSVRAHLKARAARQVPVPRS